MGIMYIVALLLLSGVVQACPENCYCETDSAECVIEGCNVGIILDVPILILHGDLCDSQMDLLLHLTDSQIILHGSLCRELPNPFKKIFKKKNFLKEDNYFSDDSGKTTAKQAKKTSSTTSTTIKITKTTRRSTQKMTHVTSSTTTTLSPQQTEENN